jgi:hypothetical protein
MSFPPAHCLRRRAPDVGLLKFIQADASVSYTIVRSIKVSRPRNRYILIGLFNYRGWYGVQFWP